MIDNKKGKTNRIEKVNALIQQQVGMIIREFVDSEEGIITISKVEASADLRWAKVWVSIINGNDEKILKILHKNLYQIQGELNRQFSMKMVPRLQFFLDTSPRYVQHIDELINKIHEEEE
jgi:ribosome-binding factor A